jgi:hypothetical protein
MIWLHARPPSATRITTETPAGDVAAEAIPNPPLQGDTLPALTTTSAPTNEPIMAQTNVAVLPMTNVVPQGDPQEALLRNEIGSLEERIHDLEQALAAAKAPPPATPSDTNIYQKPTPGTWVSTDGTGQRITISPMNEMGPWLKIRASRFGFNNVNDWGEVPLGYRTSDTPFGFAEFHKNQGSLFLILRFVQSGINVEEVWRVDDSTNVSAKVSLQQLFFVPVTSGGDAP